MTRGTLSLGLKILRAAEQCGGRIIMFYNITHYDTPFDYALALSKKLDPKKKHSFLKKAKGIIKKFNKPQSNEE